MVIRHYRHKNYKEYALKDRFLESLEQEKSELAHKIQELENTLIYTPGIHLEIKNNKGRYPQFYKCSHIQTDDGETRKVREYIKQKDQELARMLAQGEYDRQLIEDMKKRCDIIQPVIDYYRDNPKFSVYNSLGEVRKSLVESEYEDDEVFINKWYDRYSQRNPANDSFYEKHPITKPYYTERGEKVRSKSEKIIADKLFKEGIPYVYEPTVVVGEKVLHPDFATLNIVQRKTYIYEHFGMMDNPEYAALCVNKIAVYDKNGFVYGNNLLYSFETQNDGLDIKMIERMLKRFLID